MSVAVIDIGNSRIKAAVFDESESLANRITLQKDAINDLDAWYKEQKLTGAILSSTGGVSDQLKTWVELNNIHFLNSGSALPFKNNYATPHTLGTDRMAAIAGAVSLMPGHDILLIDAGTCVTYDIINSAKVYLGGNISPGLNMRLKAMHEFTASLPLVESNDEFFFYGTSTEEAIRCGAQTGLLMEITGFIESFQNNFPDLSIYVSGGDASYIQEHLTIDVIHEPDLVLIGLFKIFLCQ